MSGFKLCLTAIVFGLSLVSNSATAEIEAVKGKRYTLTKQHGPWMIMVASIRDVTDESRRKKDGMTAWQAADELVYELRRKGIPAYTYVRETKVGDLTNAAADGLDSRQYIAEHGYISVLACNFKSNDDQDLTRVLDYVKEKFRPEFLTDEKNGGVFARTPGRPGPLSKAFVTVNPMLSPEEVKSRTVDKLMLALNHDMEYSLLKNKGRYTLVVATFHGKSIAQVGNQVDSKNMAKFENNFGSNLDKSGMDAWSLTEALRDAKKLGYDQNYEAYVFHDRNKSYVTVGSFDDRNDPRIRALAMQFRGKPTTNAPNDPNTVTAEFFTIPKSPKPGQLPDRYWIFDPNPRVMEVPRTK